jgi:hypothetical protein
MQRRMSTRCPARTCSEVKVCKRAADGIIAQDDGEGEPKPTDEEVDNAHAAARPGPELAGGQLEKCNSADLCAEEGLFRFKDPRD